MTVRQTAQVLYLSHAPSYSLFLTRTDATIVLPGVQNKGHGAATQRARFFRLRFGRGNQQSKVTGIETLPGTSNHFSGSDPKLWHTRIPPIRQKTHSSYKGHAGINHRVEGFHAKPILDRLRYGSSRS
jgi:hypothetical protein